MPLNAICSDDSKSPLSTYLPNASIIPQSDSEHLLAQYVKESRVAALSNDISAIYKILPCIKEIQSSPNGDIMKAIIYNNFLATISRIVPKTTADQEVIIGLNKSNFDKLIQEIYLILIQLGDDIEIQVRVASAFINMINAYEMMLKDFDKSRLIFNKLINMGDDDARIVTYKVLGLCNIIVSEKDSDVVYNDIDVANFFRQIVFYLKALENMDSKQFKDAEYALVRISKEMWGYYESTNQLKKRNSLQESLRLLGYYE